jgi:CMP/dCMP kinase
MSIKVIAIDGPAASGKSTVASLVAERLHIPYINTGNMYRAITWKALSASVDLECRDDAAMTAMLADTELVYMKNAADEFELMLDGTAIGEAIRAPEIAGLVSQVAAIPAVRKWLLDRQRCMIELGLIVMEGRDIGTVVFPDAEYKFFITAAPETRALRRLRQSGETFDGATLESVASDIAERDRVDSTRKIAPLRQAEDAQLVDTTELTIDQVVEQIISMVNV